MSDLPDWAYVASELLLAMPDMICRSIRPEYTAARDAIAAALREAFEAGQKARIDVLDCDACGERHMTSRGAEMRDELRTIRRELAARRAVDRWLQEREGMRAIGLIDGLLTALEFDDNGDQRFVAQAPDYPALAAALGLEVNGD